MKRYQDIWDACGGVLRHGLHRSRDQSSKERGGIEERTQVEGIGIIRKIKGKQIKKILTAQSMKQKMYVNFISFIVESLENDNISFFHFFLPAFLLMQVRMKINVNDMKRWSQAAKQCLFLSI